jgi:hypothetical protein
MDFVAVIDYWPSVSALARDLDESPDRVRKWRERNSIPANRWVRLVRAGKKRGYSITIEKLSCIAARAA